MNSKAKTINIPNCKDLGGDDFSGSSLECVNMESVEKIGSGSSEFLNCFSLKYVYAPNSKQIPSFISDNDGRYQLSQGVVPALEFIYAPKATEFNYDYCDFKEFTNLKFLYAPKLESIAKFSNFPKSNDFTFYLSDSLKEGKNQEAGILGKYTVVAPEGSFAEEWAKKKLIYYPNGLYFIPNEDLSFSAFDENSFIYSTPGGKQCSMPIDIVEQMWYDNLPINESSDFMTHGYIFDVVNDDFINAKDFAKIHHLSKYGW